MSPCAQGTCTIQYYMLHPLQSIIMLSFHPCSSMTWLLHIGIMKHFARSGSPRVSNLVKPNGGLVINVVSMTALCFLVSIGGGGGGGLAATRSVASIIQWWLVWLTPLPAALDLQQLQKPWHWTVPATLLTEQQANLQAGVTVKCKTCCTACHVTRHVQYLKCPGGLVSFPLSWYELNHFHLKEIIVRLFALKSETVDIKRNNERQQVW